MENKKREISQILNMAYENHKKGNLKLAENLYGKILKLDSDNFDTTFLLGTLLLQKKNYNKAINLLNKSIEINPNHANSYQNLGFAVLELGEHEKAIKLFNKAIQIEPNHIDAHFNLGNAYKQLRDFKKAQKQYEKTIQIQPTNPRAYNNLANTHKELGNFDEAIKCYTKAIQQKPNHARAYHNLGNTYNQLGDFSKAVSAFKKSFEIQPANLESLYNVCDLEKDELSLNLKKKIKEIMKSGALSKKDEAYGNFLYAKYEHEGRNFENEFSYLINGHKNYYQFKKNTFEKGVTYWLKDLPNIEALKEVKKLKETSYFKPIFIIGVPRCGSTVVEKVIASGSKRFPIGEECGVVNSIVGDRILNKEFTDKDTEYLKNKIIKKYEKLGLLKKENNYIFTDKTLDNFFYLDIIKKIFPLAKIINCKRNQISSIMSILKNNLGDVSWAHDLDHILQYFDIYFKKIDYFKKKYPGYIYDLNFENFQNNPENESKKMMKFCNLPWDKKCLDFYERNEPYKNLLNKCGKKYKWFL